MRDEARRVLNIEAAAIQQLSDRLDRRFDAAVETLLATRGRVVVSGMGKSGIIGRKIAATMASTGSPAFFLHPAEAVHGDLGMLVAGDSVLMLSATGETTEILRLLEHVRRLGLSSVAMTCDPDSTLARNVDQVLDVSIPREACPLNLAPTASTTAMLAMGDALAVALYTQRGFKPEDYARTHPGGRLGFRLARVCDLMHTGSSVPRVRAELSVNEATREMSDKGMGMTAVVDADGRLRGILTDGDLRRLVLRGADLAKTEVGSCATAKPLCIGADEPASKALKLMESRRISCLLVTDAEGALQGVVRIYDLWKLQLG